MEAVQIELSKHIVRLKKKLKKAREDKVNFEQEKGLAYTKRDETYKSVQCMTVDYVTTKDAIDLMKRINSEIERLNKKIENRIENIENGLKDIDRQESQLQKLKDGKL